MGWSFSCFLAQSSHVHIASSVLVTTDYLHRSSDKRLDRVRWFIYIDDFCCFGCDPLMVARCQQDYLRAMKKAKHVNKLSKQVLPSAEGVECIGVILNGTDHTVGLCPTKLQDLAEKTRFYLKVGKCTGLGLARLLGIWTWAFMVRRNCFSVFNAVYRFVLEADRLVFQIWPSVRQELLTAIGLLPLLFADIAFGWFPKVICADASSMGLGVVAADMAPAAVST